MLTLRTYYSVLLKLYNYVIKGCNHSSTNIHAILLSTSSDDAAVHYDANLRDLLVAKNENPYKCLRL